MSIEEFNTDGVVVSDGAFLASFRLMVDVGGVRTWHYYGTPVPGEMVGNVPTQQHDAVAVQLVDFTSAAYDVARQIAVDGLNQ